MKLQSSFQVSQVPNSSMVFRCGDRMFPGLKSGKNPKFLPEENFNPGMFLGKIMTI